MADVLTARSDELIIRYNSASRVVGTEWPAAVYLETEPLHCAVGKVRVRFEASDQGWGNTGHCYIELRGASTDSSEEVLWRQRLVTLTHATTNYDNNDLNQELIKTTPKGSTILLVAVSAPWGGYSANVRNACVEVWYSQRYEMAVLRALLDQYDRRTVDNIFMSTITGEHSDRSLLSEGLSSIGGMLYSVLTTGRSSAVPSFAGDVQTCRALSFVFGRCDPLLFSIIIKFAYD